MTKESDIVLISIPNCPACEILKAAMRRVLGQFPRLSLEVITLDESAYESLRSERPNLIFPFLRARAATGRIARRQGLTSKDPEVEADEVLKWLLAIGLGPRLLAERNE